MIIDAVWLLAVSAARGLIIFVIVENKKRIQSVDLLRGVVMIIMALDHVRDYFHRDAFFYSPEDLSQTSVPLFFTRWITHFCAPVFVFLAGISACLYGEKKGRKELAKFLLTRGFWLVLVELAIINLFRTFNPSYPFLNLQVLWAIGVSMIVLAGLIFLDRKWIVVAGVLLVAGHNLLDGVHVSGTGPGALVWSLLHDPKGFHWGPTLLNVKYPLLPWIGIMALGYVVGSYYQSWYNAEERKGKLLLMGFSCVGLFILLRVGNIYGDAAHWTSQQTAVFSFLSFLNVTKYPPSLLYTLMTIGPALIFLAMTEQPLNKWTTTGVVFGRTAMFYYLAHILLIHVLALVGVLVCGYSLSTMITHGGVNQMPALKGYGFPLIVVYLVWLGLVLLLYPLCKRYDEYKR
ncbi:MAG TPA: heparan-alpha-glucosaminide N-acetyltransferase domain-containing protein, partial [Puia sp.]